MTNLAEAVAVPPVEIEIHGLHKSFGSGASAYHALRGIDLDIREGEFFTLLGPSGCGKTTLLRLIAGFEHPSSGSLRVHGQDVTAMPPNRRKVNTVFQSYALFPHMTVAQNIGFGLKMLRLPRAEAAATVAEMLRLVRMEAMADRKPAQLSGGQQQRVALARALAPRPRVLLLDEPLSALDYKLRKEMQAELKRLQHETGITFVFVTHDQEEALAMSDRIAVMKSGEILQVGTQHEIYDAPKHRFVAGFIGEASFLSFPVLYDSTGAARAVLPGGSTVAIQLPAGMAVADRMEFAVRPEKVRLVPSGAGEASVEVVSRTYLGHDTLIALRLPDGQGLEARVQNNAASAIPDPGARLGLSLPAGSLMPLGEAADAQ
jgi:spermidine/putrescine transport system ATP-binding protein